MSQTNEMIEPDSLQHLDGNHVQWRGRTLLYFGGCDYFRLAHHPAVSKAAFAGLQRLGLSVAASRLTTGQHRVYELLEARLADFFRADAALLVPTGYLTSTVVAQAMAGEFTHVLIDEGSHPALQDAALHFRSRIATFRHRDPRDLKNRLKHAGRRARVVVLTDGMFSLDGSVAPLREYLASLPRSGMVVVDDAHGAGVLGANGRGTLEHEGVPRTRVVQCVTLSKAFGVFGGAVIGSPVLRRRMLDRSRAFMGTTPVPLLLANAALRSVAILERGRNRRARLWRNSDYIKAALRREGFPIPDFPGPIVPLHLSSQGDTRRLSRHLLDAGIYPPLIRYANSPAGLFRFVISSEHRRGQLDHLILTLARFRGAERSGGGRGTGQARGTTRRR